MNKYLVCILVLVLSSVMLIGCGGSGSDIVGNIDSDNTDTATVTGFIVDGTQTSVRASEMRYSLGGSLAGVTVYVEGRKDLFSTTNSDGRFIIDKVPLGKKSFIAEKKEMGNIAYRQRLDPVEITRTNKVCEIKTPIEMVASPYSLNYIMTDSLTGKAVVNATITVWGTDYKSDLNGKVTISNFPERSDIVATVQASGYRTFTTKLSFSESINSVGEIKMSQIGISNIPPVVAIKYIDDSSAVTIDDDKNLCLAANKYITLEGIGCDLDNPNDALVWSWSATNGQFAENTDNQKVRFMITEENTKVVITLTAKDKDNAESKATLEFNPKGESGIFFVTSKADHNGSIFLCMPSGLILEAKEPNTFDSNATIKIVENSNFECSDKEFQSVSSLFTISAEKTEISSLEGETKSKITNVEKPIRITVPNKYIIGKYYVGTRANSNSPWNYTPINNDGTSEPLYHESGRAAVSIIPKEFIINTYSTDFQFAIFVKTE